MSLRWFQKESVDAIGPYYTGEKKGNGLIGLPTGTGKSYSIAGTIRTIFENFAWHRVISLTHDKRLIQQNASKLLQIWENAPVGICSAGLNRRDINQPIIFGGIATAVGDPTAFGHRDAILIDEAHLISDKTSSMYQRFIAQQRLINPEVKIFGWSATLYRMRLGALTDNGIFDHIIYDMTDVSGFNRLLAEGYLSPLIPQPTHSQLNTDGVKVSGGEFNKGALEDAVDIDELNWKCCREMVERAWDRNCWLVFASGIKHAEHIAEILNSLGIPSAAVHSKLTSKECDARIEAFKDGRLRCLVNNGMLTTGFDHPPIDFIGMMRPTMSVPLWVQMLGRGTRPYNPDMAEYIIGFGYVKANCLVLDFAKNATRLGPINDPVLPRKPGKGGGGDVPIKLCPQCSTYNHASARFCCFCGTEFQLGGAKLFENAGTAQLIKVDAPPETAFFNVDRVLYFKLDKVGAPPMMRVSYFCGLRKFDEIICLEHNGYAKTRAKDWWRQRSEHEPPGTTAEALRNSQYLAVPKQIRVWVNKTPYPEVLKCEF